MGLVYHIACPECKKKVYIGSHISQLQCPECKKGKIVNAKNKLSSGKFIKSQKFVFTSKQETKTSTCAKCNTQFSTPAPLFRGKIFCPACGTEVKLEGVTQI